MKNKYTTLVECAVMIALASVLSMLKVYEAPLGGSVTLFSMVPILVLSFRHGPLWGMGSAFIYSVIQLILGVGTVAYVPTAIGVIICIVLDYFAAFTLIGLAGLFKIKVEDSTKAQITKIVLGSLLACIIRYTCHFFSGAVVWYEITKLGNWNEYVHKVGMWTYTTVYNAQYMVPETILTLIAVPAMVIVLKAIKKPPRKIT